MAWSHLQTPIWNAEICTSATRVRTTLDLNDDLLAEAKAFAARDKLSLTRLIEERLALRLRLPKPGAAAVPRAPTDRQRHP